MVPVARASRLCSRPLNSNNNALSLLNSDTIKLCTIELILDVAYKVCKKRLFYRLLIIHKKVFNMFVGKI